MRLWCNVFWTLFLRKDTARKENQGANFELAIFEIIKRNHHFLVGFVFLDDTINSFALLYLVDDTRNAWQIERSAGLYLGGLEAVTPTHLLDGDVSKVVFGDDRLDILAFCDNVLDNAARIAGIINNVWFVDDLTAGSISGARSLVKSIDGDVVLRNGRGRRQGNRASDVGYGVSLGNLIGGNLEVSIAIIGRDRSMRVAIDSARAKEHDCKNHGKNRQIWE